MRVNTASILILGALLLGGCNSSNNNDEEEVILEAPAAVSKVTINLQDLSGAPLSGVSVSIDDNDTDLLAKLVGRSAGIVSRSAAKKFEQRISLVESDSFGDVSFELAEGTTEGDLSITVDEGGYFPVTKIYTIGSESTFDVLVLTPKPAAGSTVAVEAVDDDGEVEEVISLSADQEFVEEVVEVVDDAGAVVNVQGTVSRIETKNTDADTGKKTVVAEVVIPQTVQPKTASGAASVGKLSVTAAIYQNSSDVAIDAFPGGLDIGANLDNADTAPPIPVPDEEDASDTTGFITGGFVTLEVTDEEGNDITQFDGSTGVDIDGDGVEEKGLLVTSLISKKTVNPKTNALVKIGDSIPVWSYDDKTAKWTYDGESKIFEEADAKNFRARFAATHLSTWNLDFNVAFCSGIKLIGFVTPAGEIDRRQLKVVTRLNAGFTRTSYVYGDGFLASWRSPREKLQIAVTDRSTGQPVAIQSINGQPYNASEGYNFCSQVFTVKNVVLEPAPVLVDVNVKVETSCSNATAAAKPVPSATVTLINSLGNRVSNRTTNSAGEVTLSGLDGDSDYYVYVEDRVTYGIPSVVGPFKPDNADDPMLFNFPKTCTVTTGSSGGT